MTISGLYGSVNGKATNVGKFLGSVDTRAKSARKLYGSVDGKARVVARFHVSHPLVVASTLVIRLTQNEYDTSNAGKTKVTFEWVKGTTLDIYGNVAYYKDEANENVTYEVLDGTSVVDHGTLASNTNGTAKQGSKSLTLSSGHKITIRVTNTLISGAGSQTTELVFYTAVANAVINTPVTWNDVRRAVTVSGKGEGAVSLRMTAGYTYNGHEISDKNTNGTTATVTVNDPNHGTGQVLYFSLIPRANDGHEYTENAAYLSIEVPNPILGVATDSAQKRYIVDIVEHKADGTITPKWQNGDRIVKK